MYSRKAAGSTSGMIPAMPVFMIIVIGIGDIKTCNLAGTLSIMITLGRVIHGRSIVHAKHTE
jgi:hypothetical protein